MFSEEGYGEGGSGGVFVGGSGGSKDSEGEDRGENSRIGVEARIGMKGRTGTKGRIGSKGKLERKGRSARKGGSGVRTKVGGKENRDGECSAERADYCCETLHALIVDTMTRGVINGLIPARHIQCAKIAHSGY